MEKKKESETDNIDNNIVLPSFIDKKYLEQRFNEGKINEIKEIDKNELKYRIKIFYKNLRIYEIDRTKNIEQKIYEYNNFPQFIKLHSKLKHKKEDFSLEVMAIFKSGIFIIQSEDIITYGAFFFMKFNYSKKKLNFKKNMKEKLIT